ncbi:Fusaric acid resistance protein-like [Sesbania bispinosa]|nr:Fusaric acid resistance protein-like [Sesbania bispinosa]
MTLGGRRARGNTKLRGMELALSSTNSFPVNTLDEDLKHGLNSLEEHVSLTIKNAKHGLLGGSLTVPESNAKTITHFLQSLHTIPTTRQELPIFFFLFCAKLLQKKSSTEPPQEKPVQKNGKFPEGKENKENGFWAGLPVAVSYVSGREATFRAANVKAQGTVIGTVYGVVGCFVFERFMPIRFFSLLPWFIFASFLQRSRMYGPAGGISAVIGAVLILGPNGLQLAPKWNSLNAWPTWSSNKNFKMAKLFGKEDVNMLQGEVGDIKELICSSIKSLEEISRMKSLGFVEKELEKKNISYDIESGKSRECKTCMVSGLGEDGIGETIGSFLQRSRDAVDKLYGDEGEKEVKSEVVLSLSALGSA